MNDGLKEFGRRLLAFQDIRVAFFSAFAPLLFDVLCIHFDHDCAKQFVNSYLSGHKPPSPKLLFFIWLNNSISRL